MKFNKPLFTTFIFTTGCIGTDIKCMDIRDRFKGKSPLSRVQALFDDGQDSNEDVLGRKLCNAIRIQNAEDVRLLICAGAPVNYVDTSFDPGDQTPLSLAATYDNLPIVKMLVQAGARYNNAVDGSLLQRVVNNIEGNQDEIAEILIRAGADIEKLYHGETALTDATKLGHSTIVEALVRAGANIYHRSTSGFTPLMECNGLTICACLLTACTTLTPIQKDAVKNWLLVDHRLRSERRGLHKDLKRMIANAICRSLANDLLAKVMETGGQEALDCLQPDNTIPHLKQYLDLDFLTERAREQTLLPKHKKTQDELNKELREAIESGTDEKVLEQIRRGADINYQPEFHAIWGPPGWGALEIAIMRGRHDIINILLHAGIQINTGRQNPLEFAAYKGDVEIFKTLINAGINIYRQRKNGRSSTALVKTVEFNKIELTKILLDEITRLTSTEKKEISSSHFQYIDQSVSIDLRERMFRAGALEALKWAKEKNNAPMVELLEKYLDLTFLKQLVRTQTCHSKDNA